MDQRLLIRDTSFSFLFELFLRINSFSQLIVDRSMPSLQLVPMNRLLAWTIVALPLVGRITSNWSIAFRVVVDRWQALTFIPAMHEEWALPVILFMPGSLLLPLSFFLLSPLILVQRYPGCYTARLLGISSLIISATTSELVNRYMHSGINNS